MRSCVCDIAARSEGRLILLTLVILASTSCSYILDRGHLGSLNVESESTGRDDRFDTLPYIQSMAQRLPRSIIHLDSGLERMLHHLGWRSNLAKAHKVVAFVNHGIMLHRPGPTRKADMQYHDLLGTFAKALQNLALATTPETMAIAMLLGLYEVQL